MRQNQKSGNQSVNIQAGTVNVGLTYDDVKEIARDVFEANFYRLSGAAVETAKERADHLIEGYLASLAEKNPAGVESAQDPDMQHALFIAQKEYARSGDEQLGEVLIDILVDRASQTERSIMQIVLNESIEVAPKLTDYQFDILSLVFLFRYTKHTGLGNLELLQQYLRKMALPFLSGLRRDDSSFQHLEFAGCGTVQMGSIKIEKIIRQQYSGLFCKGFSKEELDKLIAEKHFPQELFLPCLHDHARFQIRALDADQVQTLAKENGLDDPRATVLVNAFNSNLLPESEIRQTVVSMVPEIEKLFEMWDETPLKSFTLTSVGIAIGHANIRRKTGEQFDLGIWIK